MPIKKLLKDTQKAGELIVVALLADRQRNKDSRHAKYRAKRISEATSLWNDYNKKLSELKTALPNPTDPCVIEAEQKYTEAYKNLTERLLAIPEVVNQTHQSGSETETEDTAEEITRIIKTQWNRLTKIDQLLQEVKNQARQQ